VETRDEDSPESDGTTKATSVTMERRRGDGESGKSIPHTGSAEGATNSTGVGPKARLDRRRPVRTTGRIVGEILEGESKAMSGATLER
jgi:hypothetical protein